MEFDDDSIYDDDSYDSCDDENENEEVAKMEFDDGLLNLAAVDDDSKEKCKYSVLSFKDISERQQDVITEVSKVLSLSEVEASILLRHSDWNVNNVYDQWFADEEKVRNAVGLLLHQEDVKHHDTPPREEEEENELIITCPICLEDCNIRDTKALKYCGHMFCKECSRNYINSSINNDGSGCLNLRCPNVDPRCRAVVSEDIVFSLGLSQEDIHKYRSYLVHSYVQRKNSKVKWCPAPNCEYAVEVHAVVSGNATLEVVCKCSYAFCWNCLEESHRPIHCDTVRKWVAMINDGESQSKYWVLGNSKPCPKCKRPIEKNSGCMHMMCLPPCGFQFCWICLGQWDVHVNANCNRYRPQEIPVGENGGQPFSEDVMKMSAKMFSDRLLFYLERWKANEKSQEKALSDLKRVQAVDLQKMSDFLVLTRSKSGMTGFKCVTDAWQQIVECRRMVKWTYAYGYYLPSLYEPDAERVEQKQNFFDFLQGEAENSLERLHQCAEHELQHYINHAYKAELAGTETSRNLSTLTEFDDFCKKLEGLTQATAGYFEKLIQAFENELSEVDM